MSAIPLVLYAEDDENDAFFMERAFTKLRAKEALRIVQSGRRAVDYLAGHGEFCNRAVYPHPEIVILDVKMPEMNGLEALAWIRARHEFDRLLVVMFTSSTQQSDVEFSRKHGANGYLVKPSNADNLAKMVEQVLSARRTVTLPAQRLPLEGNAL
jgi:CheY-like chemotaxis protein